MATERVVFDSGYLIEAVDPTQQEWQLDAMYVINAAAHRQIEVVCPYLLTIEIGAVCLRKVKSKAIKEAQALRLFDLMATFEIDVDVMISSPKNVYEFAKGINCQGYDGVYLMLAKMLGLPIASRDGGILAGAKALKIPVWQPPTK